MNIKQPVLTLSILLALPFAALAMERTELLPPDAQSYIRLSDTTEFWSQLKASSVGKLWVDPQFQDFLGNPDSDTWMELFFEGEPNAKNKVFIEQFKMLTGELILAFDPEQEGPYIIAAMTKDDFLRSLELDANLKEIGDSSLEIIKSTFQNVEIIQHIEAGGTPAETSYWQAHVSGTLVVGGKKEWVEKCIVQLEKEPTIEPKGTPILSINLPLSKLIRDEILEAMKADGASTPDEPEIDSEAFLEALGLMGIENWTLTLELKETEMVADSTLRVSDLTKGIFTLLDTQPSELPSVSFIPENIASLEIGRVNLLRFWQEIPKVLAAVAPDNQPQFDMALAMIQQQIGIDLEQDLLSHLGTKYLSFSTAANDRQVSVIAVELKDAAAFKTGLETTMASPILQPQVAANLKTETFLDHTIYTALDDDPNEALAFGVAANYLLYGQPEGLRQVLRAESSENQEAPSFEQSALVKGLREHVPPQAFAYGAIDWRKHMDFLVRELSKPEYVAVLQQKWATTGSPLPPPDFSKLPTADHIAAFFNISYQYAEATREGLHQRIILKY